VNPAERRVVLTAEDWGEQKKKPELSLEIRSLEGGVPA